MPRYRSSRRKTFSRSTRRKIIETVALKKRDDMMLQTYVTATEPYATAATQLPAVLRGDFNGSGVPADRPLDRTPYAFLWCATARGITDSVSDSARTVLDPYMVGLREAIEIQVTTGCPWQWRRICFTTKRDMVAALGTTGNSKFFTGLSDASARRTIATLAGNRNTGEQYALYELLFQGQNATDWVDPMVAKVDTTRASIRYDKTMTITCGNERGMIRKYRRWHSMNKRLVYNGDESGGNEISSDFSTRDAPGMGDYYVLDLFRARNGAASDDILTFSPQATLYWHEK